MKLKSKTALITGGSKGIGRSVAEAYVKDGASVIICARSESALNSAKDEISRFGEVDSIQCDIVNKQDVKNLTNFVSQKWGKLDILVNNASILGVRSTIIDYPEDVWADVINVNLNGQFYLTKALLPLLLKSEQPSIINVNSAVGYVGKATWGAYSASKFGMEALNQILADELQTHNFRVNSVNPGATRTKMRAEAYPDEDPQTLPTPDDISPVFLYLASDESQGVTGKVFEARDWIRK
ncbi:MAG: SDR family NAD(P)-dependent oxidoreductase [Candidatus Dadabacteria bacterium]|nr:SDR family NAD(P)-dependent oxidoreductase [Candidatus Dadabacteria bacterium]